MYVLEGLDPEMPDEELALESSRRLLEAGLGGPEPEKIIELGRIVPRKGFDVSQLGRPIVVDPAVPARNMNRCLRLRVPPRKE